MEEHGNAPYRTPYELDRFNFEFSPTQIDGKLYWLWYQNKYANCIVSFDFDNEQFDFLSIPSPPLHDEQYYFPPTNWTMIVFEGRLVVLRPIVSEGRLVVFRSFDSLWIMKEYGVWESLKISPSITHTDNDLFVQLGYKV